jgi:hypothetical protein
MDAHVLENKYRFGSNYTSTVLSDKIYSIIKNTPDQFNSEELLNFRLAQLNASIKYGMHLKWKPLSK